jgi:hypothetical protein
MPVWLSRLLAWLGDASDALSDAWDRLLAITCVLLVIPLTAAANVMLILGVEHLRDLLDRLGLAKPLEDWGLYVIGGTAALVLFASFSASGPARRLRDLIDGKMVAIAFTVSGLLALFALLLWLDGEALPL